MTPERWERLKDLLYLARSPGKASRGDPAAAHDPASLRADLEALLEADAQRGTGLERLADGIFDHPPTPPAAPPPEIDGLRVVRSLASGGFGDVYLCEQSRPARFVAVKVLRTVPGAAARSLLREAQFLATLSHPGIAKVYAVGEFTPPGGRFPLPYFSMEFVDGGRPITAHARAENTGVRGRIELFLQACDAVEHAHTKGVVHRDLKPGNILAGVDGRVKILDFGISRRLRAAQSEHSESLDVGSLVGTLAYMSPEQATGGDTLVDTRSDVYSLGLVLFELLSDRPAFPIDGLSMFEALRRLGEGRVPRLASAALHLAGDLDAIVAKATARDLHDRYRSVAALSADLRRWLNNLPVEARPPSASYRARKFIRRNRLLVSLAAATAAAITVAFVLTARALDSAHAANRTLSHTTGVLLNDAVRLLAPVVGAHEGRRALLISVHRTARQIAEANPSDAGALRNLARSLLELGNLDLDEGALESARSAFSEALALAGRVSRAIPDDPEAALFHSTLLIRRGDVAMHERDFAQGEALYSEAAALHRRWATAHPRDDRWVGELVFDCERLASLARDCGDPAACMRLTAEQLQWADLLVRMRGADASSMHALASAHCLMSFRLLDADLHAALLHAEHSVRASEQGGLWAPSNAVYSRSHIRCIEGLGLAQQAIGRHEGAFASFDRAFSLARSLAERDDTDLANRAVLASTLSGRARANNLLGRVADSLADFEEASRLAGDLADRVPGNAGWVEWSILLDRECNDLIARHPSLLAERRP